MKKTIITYVILCFLIPSSIEAKKNPFGNGLNWELTEDGTLIISGNGEMPDFYYYGKWIIKAPWYNNREKIRRVVIDEGITSIGNESFRAPWASNYIIEEVVLSSTIERIGKYAFLGCRKLKKITFNDGLYSIEDEAFGSCNLDKIVLPSSVCKIGEYCFSGNPLTSVVLSDNITTIPTGAFMNCKLLKQIKYPSKLKRIEGDAFGFSSIEGDRQGCLEYIDLPSGVEYIGSYAFCGNVAKYLKLPESIREIGKNAFALSSRYAKPIVNFKGEILSLPLLINENNAVDYGLDKNAVWYFQNRVSNLMYPLCNK